MPAALEILTFPELTHDDHYLVRDTEGRLVARFATKSFSRRFTATDPDGTVLCTGRPQRLLRRYVVSDAAGARLLTLRTAVFSNKRRTGRLADGSRLRLRSAGWPSPTWTVTDPAGNPSLVVEPARGRWSLHVRDLVARVGDPGWSLALVVAVVVGNRMEGEASRLSDLIA